MHLADSRTGIEVVTRDDCLRLLREDVIGRLAVVSGGAPHVFPVNYAMDGEDVVFRTDHGTKLDVGPRSPACFEIDRFERTDRSGWSVVVAGRLEEVTAFDSERLHRIETLGIDPWADGERQHWMRLVPGTISGRRVGSTPLGRA
jgi:nitroimidazol reductase NimA-like FMN-containing flavoprotein (pyridoxamine 5'-phosphate oxidase superfamily)